MVEWKHVRLMLGERGIETFIRYVFGRTVDLIRHYQDSLLKHLGSELCPLHNSFQTLIIDYHLLRR